MEILSRFQDHDGAVKLYDDWADTENAQRHYFFQDSVWKRLGQHGLRLQVEKECGWLNGPAEGGDVVSRPVRIILFHR